MKNEPLHKRRSRPAANVSILAPVVRRGASYLWGALFRDTCAEHHTISLLTPNFRGIQKETNRKEASIFVVGLQVLLRLGTST